mmetsp:Transcript_16567/g.36644  ORF Transcript_16567/g.36644 Transcript_16567/m.36644 type:complete len:240 (+) Transcript_16567:551-1270(+)
MTSSSFSHSLSLPSTSLENCSTRGDLLWWMTGSFGRACFPCCAACGALLVCCFTSWVARCPWLACFATAWWAACSSFAAPVSTWWCPWWAACSSLPAWFRCLTWCPCCVLVELAACTSWAGGVACFAGRASAARRLAPAAAPPALWSVLAYLGGRVLALPCSRCWRWALGGVCATVGPAGAAAASGASMSFSKAWVSKSSAGAMGGTLGAATTLRGPWSRPFRKTPRRPPPIPAPRVTR